MSDEKDQPFGILVGVMGVKGESPLIGISAGGQLTMTITVDHAGMIFEQLGFVLEQLGYFDDDEFGDCETCDNKDDCEESICKTKH